MKTKHARGSGLLLLFPLICFSSICLSIEAQETVLLNYGWRDTENDPAAGTGTAGSNFVPTASSTAAHPTYKAPERSAMTLRDKKATVATRTDATLSAPTPPPAEQRCNYMGGYDASSDACNNGLPTIPGDTSGRMHRYYRGSNKMTPGETVEEPNSWSRQGREREMSLDTRVLLENIVDDELTHDEFTEESERQLLPAEQYWTKQWYFHADKKTVKASMSKMKYRPQKVSILKNATSQHFDTEACFAHSNLAFV